MPERCPYCMDAPAPPEQFYETKLFRVLVVSPAFGDGHVAIVPKRHEPHFYALDLDELEEFGYLVKKVSFWIMRWRKTVGFMMGFSDGGSESMEQRHLFLHIIPRDPQNAQIENLIAQWSSARVAIETSVVLAMVKELQNLMQLPQKV